MSLAQIQRIQPQQDASITKAIALATQAQGAKESGDMVKFEQYAREFKLLAKERQLKDEQRHAKEIKALEDQLLNTSNKLQKALSENALKGRIQQALEDEDIPRFNRLLNLYTKSSTPTNIQSLDRYQSEEENGFVNAEDRTTTRNLLGGEAPSPIERLRIARESGTITVPQEKAGALEEFGIRDMPEITDTEADIRALKKLNKERIISDEQYQSALNHLTNKSDAAGTNATEADIRALKKLKDEGVISDEQYQNGLNHLTNKPGTDTSQMSTNEKDVAALRKFVDEYNRSNPKDPITPEDEKDMIIEIFGGSPSGSDTDPDLDEQAAASIQGLAITDPIRRSSNNVSVGIPKDYVKNLDTRVYNITGGAGWEALANTQKSAVADLYAQAVETGKQAGGEIAQREAVAMQLLRRELPAISKALEDLEGVEIGTGKALQLTEGFFRIAGGTTVDPKVSAAVTVINNLTNAFIALRSGAAVTEDEYQRYRNLLGDIGKTRENNIAIIDQLTAISDRAVGAYYDKKLDRSVVDTILGDTAPVPIGWTEELIEQAMERTGNSRGVVINRIRERAKERANAK